MAYNTPIGPYTGRFERAQDKAFSEANQLCKDKGGELLSRQAVAVLRVLVEEIETLKLRIKSLESQLLGSQ